MIRFGAIVKWIDGLFQTVGLAALHGFRLALGAGRRQPRRIPIPIPVKPLQR